MIEQYEIMGDDKVKRVIIELMRLNYAVDVSNEMMLHCQSDIIRHSKERIKDGLLYKIRDYIVIKETDEFNSTRYVGEICLPLIHDEKISELNNEVYNLEVSKNKLEKEIKRLNDWIKQPWYKKLYWRLK